MKNPLIILAALVVISAAVYWATAEFSGESNSSVYMNDTYDISFEYPDTYELQEREVGNGERYRYAITLIDKEALANIPQNGEGPPAINVEIFQNNLDKLSVETWVRGTNFSNFKLSPDGTLTVGTVAGTPALSYIWDGLYRGRSVVVAHKGNIIMLSVQWLTEEDAIIKDFADLLTSFDLN